MFWNPLGYGTGGGTIDEWANPTSSYWIGTDGFSAQVAKYGQPKEIWIQLCENYSKTPSSYAQVHRLFTILKQHSPGASYYVSAINIYSPFTLCSMMGPSGQGETDTVKWRDQAVAAGLAFARAGYGAAHSGDHS